VATAAAAQEGASRGGALPMLAGLAVEQAGVISQSGVEEHLLVADDPLLHFYGVLPSISLKCPLFVLSWRPAAAP